MTSTRIRGGRVIDPSQGIDTVADLVLQDGKVVSIGTSSAAADIEIDATDMIVCPGLIDMHVSLREPGFEEDETIATGAAAALAGGITSVACMPDTQPVVDNRAAAEFIILQAGRAGLANVFPLGAVTKDCNGEELAEIGQLVEAGVVAFSDATRPLANAEIMRRALEYCGMFNRPIFNHPAVPELVHGGVMHEDYVSTELGLRGMPAAAEDISVGRDIALAKVTGGRVHLQTISSLGSIDQIRRAKAAGLRVTAEISPHNFTLMDERLRTFNSNYKVDPPLRTADHLAACIEGLQDGTIDAICSDHQPYAPEKKSRELNLVPFGVSGLETLLPISIASLIEPGHLDWPQLIGKLTNGPANILGIPKGTLATGAEADVTIIDPQVEWTIDATQFRSRGHNTPFDGWKVRGRARTVLVAGVVVYEV
ncbi:Dihydroorotase [Symmachiella macrocystis]|uniref:Dihydroorotase n=1 Tax=Symmachiella macrocystis TaxID=2527985 RepID=A0A5C6BTK6_9PLAN|nr:dihydroorotase [Symmachiella macrocystis]TWU14034.1 Dihydroorotase [Symmachiella macrocystis]